MMDYCMNCGLAIYREGKSLDRVKYCDCQLRTAIMESYYRMLNNKPGHEQTLQLEEVKQLAKELLLSGKYDPSQAVMLAKEFYALVNK